jgi:hypothetical protein
MNQYLEAKLDRLEAMYQAAIKAGKVVRRPNADGTVSLIWKDQKAFNAMRKVARGRA